MGVALRAVGVLWVRVLCRQRHHSGGTTHAPPRCALPWHQDSSLLLEKLQAAESKEAAAREQLEMLKHNLAVSFARASCARGCGVCVIVFRC